MIFKLYNSDFGMKLNGIDYVFSDTDSFTLEDPTFNRLTRGASGQNKVGITYVEGNKEPKTLNVTILGMPPELKAALDDAFKKKQRIESVYAIDRDDGSSKILKNAILCQEAQQLTLDETPESMNVILIFQSFDLQEKHKS